jgi:methylmalonyl-CoA mutase N-terminal domain/subunit
MGYLAAAATRALRSEFPPQVATVGDLARWIVAHKTDLAGSTPGKWTREQVAARVREVVIEQLDCAETYREDASFIQDLDMDKW